MARADPARLPLRCDPRRASRRRRAEPRDFTDDAGIAEWFGLDVVLVEGSEDNRKLTIGRRHSPPPSRMLARAAEPAANLRVATGYDVHAFGPGDAVILCGVRIPHDEETGRA